MKVVDRVADKNQHYAFFLERFSAWAQQTDSVRAAIIVGSRARTNIYDTWHGGRFFDRWAAPEVREE